MPFQLSPNVLVVEKDLTNTVPAVATSIGGFVGQFQWGPVLEVTPISSELDLVGIFGKPNTLTYESFFSAANYLSYSNSLLNVRVVDTTARNAVTTGTAVAINNSIAWEASYANGEGEVGEFAAKYPGVLGNSLKVSMCDSATWVKTLTGTAIVSLAGTAVTGGTAFLTELHVGAVLTNSTSTVIGTVLSIESNIACTLTSGALVANAGGEVHANWEYKEYFDNAPGTTVWTSTFGGSLDELHVVVEDHDGMFTGTPGTMLEKFVGLSKASDAKTSDGAINYYKSVLETSAYIWWMDHPTNVTGATAWGSVSSSTFKTLVGALRVKLAGGLEGGAVTTGNLTAGWDLFVNAESFDVSLLFTGAASLTVAKHVVENIAEVRKDCVVAVSPALVSVLNKSTTAIAAAAVVNERTVDAFNVNSSYAIMDSGWKYQYDKYNDIYRWIPLNPDIAGLCARTDNIADPWWSPGGFNRGQIKNVVKLAFSPTKADRDTLYKNGINPVVSFPGEGTVLYGDKTLLTKPSAFDRINVRRLFIVLEKAIATAGKYQLFEFNDAFTRAQFRNLVEPFLRDVKGRRGVYDFRVVCDDTNNTGQVIDNNEFVADIYIKPARSINFIQLNFIATRTSVSFTEIVGA